MAVLAGRPGQMDLSRLQGLLEAVAKAHVLCVGDLVVDRFVYGAITRISAEAPIPILARTSELAMLGAAANVARNVATLGAGASLISVVGADAGGEEARRLVAAEARLDGRLAVQPGRVTGLNTRFAAAGQQLLRVDQQDVRPIDASAETQVLDAIRAAPRAGAILLSDYGRGAVTPAVVGACLAAARQAGIPLIVDSKARDLAKYAGADIIKPNAAELSRAVDLAVETDEEVAAALDRALALCDCGAVLVTRGGRGMSLAQRGRPTRHYPTTAHEVFDVSGAGDTALAGLGAALAAGAGLDDAIGLALLASGVAVRKQGTAVVTPAEVIAAGLAERRIPAGAKIATLQGLVDQVERWRAQGLRIGFTNGCFDILHRGHVAYLAQARSWCDRLVVGLNSDRSVRALKGPERPVNDLEARALVLAGLSSVDLVTAFDEDTPLRLIELCQPDLLVKGGDYAIEDVVGHAFVRSYGGDVRLADFVEGYSTSAAVDRLAARR